MAKLKNKKKKEKKAKASLAAELDPKMAEDEKKKKKEKEEAESTEEAKMEADSRMKEEEEKIARLVSSFKMTSFTADLDDLVYHMKRMKEQIEVAKLVTYLCICAISEAHGKKVAVTLPKAALAEVIWKNKDSASFKSAAMGTILLSAPEKAMPDALKQIKKRWSERNMNIIDAIAAPTLLDADEMLKLPKATQFVAANVTAKDAAAFQEGVFTSCEVLTKSKVAEWYWYFEHIFAFMSGVLTAITPSIISECYLALMEYLELAKWKVVILLFVSILLYSIVYLPEDTGLAIFFIAVNISIVDKILLYLFASRMLYTIVIATALIGVVLGKPAWIVFFGTESRIKMKVTEDFERFIAKVAENTIPSATDLADLWSHMVLVDTSDEDAVQGVYEEEDTIPKSVMLTKKKVAKVSAVSRRKVNEVKIGSSSGAVSTSAITF